MAGEQDVNPFSALVENPFSAIAGGTRAAAKKVSGTTYSVTKSGVNLAGHLLDFAQRPTTAKNQLLLGEKVDTSRVVTGTDVIKTLEERPIEDRFSGPNPFSLVANPFMELATTGLKNFPAMAATVIKNVYPEDRSKVENALTGAIGRLPGVPDAVGGLLGKVAANPEVPLGLAFDIGTDPLNLAVPLASKLPAVAKGIQVVRKAGATLGDIFPSSLREAFINRFVSPVKRVEPGVRDLYEDAQGVKALAQRDIVEEGVKASKDLAPAIKATGLKKMDFDKKLFDLVEKKNYTFEDAIALLPKDTEASNQVHKFVLQAKTDALEGASRLKKAGLTFEELKGLDYTVHSMTPGAKAALKKVGGVQRFGLSDEMNMRDPSLYARAFIKPDGQPYMLSEVNDLFAAGKFPDYEGIKIKEFFESDPVVARALGKFRTEKVVAEKNFFEGLRQFASKKIDAVEINAPLQGNNVLAGMKFDPVVKELVEQAQNVVFKDAITTAFNKVQNVWKGLVTAINPGFHVRNGGISNVIANAAEGIVNPRLYANAAAIQRGEKGFITLKNGKQLSYQEVRDYATKTGIDQGFFGSDFKTTLKQEIKGPGFNPMARGRQVGGAVETNAKIAHFVGKLEAGLDVKSAANSVKKTLFDYNDLTEFERTVMKSYVPFYTWVRKNIPRQVELVATKPTYVSRQALVASNIESAEPQGKKQFEARPGYFDEMLAFSLGKTPSGKRDLYMSIATPLSDLTRFHWDPKESLLENFVQTAVEFLGDINPFAKIGLEVTMAAVGGVGTRPVSIFTKQSIAADKNNELVRVPEYIGMLPVAVQKLIGVKRTARTGSLVMPKYAGIVINNLVSVPWLRIAGKVNAPILTEEDKAFAVMSFVSGLKFIPADTQKNAFFQYREKVMERKARMEGKRKFRDPIED